MSSLSLMTKIYEPDIETKFQNKYRIPSTRLKNYDYSQNGAYFVTICAKNREHWFGKIVISQLQYEMRLSEIGNNAQKYWLKIPNHFSFVKLGEFVVMPNHIHGIVIIDKNDNYIVETPNVETPKLGVSTGNDKKYWKSGNLGVIINQYKRVCTIQSRQINPNFAWQSRFYDRIIRNEKEYGRISEYIFYNPQNWEKDDYFYFVK